MGREMADRRKLLALVFLAVLLLVELLPLFGLSRAPILHNTIESLEEAWRKGPGHRYIEELANQTQIRQQHWRPWAIIFQHVPRTGGDALYTHLFPTTDAYLGDAWWGETHLPRFYDELKAHGDFNWSSPARRSLYKGFISGADLQEIRNGPWKDHWQNVRTFTILRDPVERVLSSVKHLKKNGINICKRQLEDMLKAKSCSGLTFLEEKLKTYLHNTMTYQLGDRLNSTLRRKSPREAVRQAKEQLKSMDFIGFYEDWQTDYYALREAIFLDFEASQDGPQSLPRSALGLVRRVLFYLGTLIARPRMRVRKYAAQVTSDLDWELLREHTRYDQELYDFARTLKGRPLNPFYNNYGEFLLYEGPSMLAAVVPFFILLCLACRCCCGRLGIPRVHAMVRMLARRYRCAEVVDGGKST